MRRRALLGGLAGLGAASLAGCMSGPLYRYRYKLTLNVLDHGVLRTSSNVVQIDTVFGTGPSLGNSVSREVSGDANVVTLGDGRVLVALLTKRDPVLDGGRAANDWGQDEPWRLLARVYGIAIVNQTESEDAKGVSRLWDGLSKARGARAIALSDLPTLVTFRDVRDPLTVETVDPENLAAKFGPGVSLQSATIEGTDDKISRGIERVLPWLARVKGYLSGQQFASDPSLASNLDVGDFRL